MIDGDKMTLAEHEEWERTKREARAFRKLKSRVEGQMDCYDRMYASNKVYVWKITKDLQEILDDFKEEGEKG